MQNVKDRVMKVLSQLYCGLPLREILSRLIVMFIDVDQQVSNKFEINVYFIIEGPWMSGHRENLFSN